MKKFIILLFITACKLPTGVDRSPETRIIPADGVQYRATAPGGTNRVEVIMVGAGGQPNLFVMGSGGGYIHLYNVPFEIKDTMYVKANPALPRSTPGWYRGSPSYVYFTKHGGAIAESGTAYYEPGGVRYDASLIPFMKNSGNGERATETTKGCSYLGFGCGADFSADGMGARIELRFYYAE